MRTRFRFEAGLAGASAFLFGLTVVWRDWVEAVFGLDPDGHRGAAEWLVCAVLLAIALASGRLARVERRRASITATPSD